MHPTCPAPSPGALRRRASQGIVLCCAVGMAACSTLTPQVFSPRLVPAPKVSAPQTDDSFPRDAQAPAAAASQPATDGDIPVETAIREAQAVQSQYLTAVKDLAEVGAGTSAALIVLSALGMYKAVTNPSSRALAAIGIAGAATYAYGSTMTSHPRQLLFLAGAETLNCAMAATRPYALPAGWLVATPSTAPTVPDHSLDGLAMQAETQVQVLRRQIDTLKALNVAQTVTETVGAPAPEGCARQVLPVCTPPASGANPDRQRAHEQCRAVRAAAAARCAGLRASQRLAAPDPQVGDTLRQLQVQRRYLAKLAAKAREQLVVFGGAGNALWQVTVDTQIKVAQEVLKTEPDLSAVLSAAQAMRGTAFALTSAPAFQPAASAPDGAAPSAAAKAESEGKPGTKAKALPTATLEPPAELTQARAEIEVALRIGDLLKVKLDTLNERLRATRVPLDRCGQGVAGAALTLSPDVSDLEIAPGSSRSFMVSGGSGTPQASLLAGDNPRPGVLSRNLDGSFSYQAAAEASDGSTVSLRFTDGSGRLAREVVLRIERPEAGSQAGTVDFRSLQLAAVAAAVGITTQPPNDKEVGLAVESCLKDKLKVTPPDLEHIRLEDLARIMSGGCRG